MTTFATSLENLFKPVQLRRAGLALCLWGEAGIGKTFKAQHLLREVAIRSVNLHATASHSDIAKTIPKGTKTSPWAARMLERAVGGEPVDASDFTSSLMSALTTCTPFVLHLEDLHEANPERLEFWLTVANNIDKSRGLMLLVTSRRAAPEPFRNQLLEPLERLESDAILEEEFKANLPSEALVWIYARAAGNPLFTLEFGRFLARTGYLWSDGRSWNWRVPAANLVPVSVEALIEQSLTKLEGQASLKNALEAKAMLPRQANQTLWGQVAELEPPELLLAISELERLGVLRNAEFAHPLYREVAFQNLNPNKRLEFSRRALEALLDHDVRLAASFIEGAKLEPDRALAFLERAATTAEAAGDPAQAAGFLAQASEYAHGETRGRLAFKAATGLRGSQFGLAIRLAEIALQMLPSDLAVIYELAEMYAANGQANDVTRTLERLPSSVLDGLEHWEHMIFINSWLGNPSQAVKLWLEHPEWHETATPNTIYRAAFSMPHHQNTERLALVNHTLERPGLTPLERAKLLAIVASTHFEESRASQAIQVFTQVIELAREAGNRVGEAAMLGNRSGAYYDLDRLEECRQDLEACLQIQLEDGDPLGYALGQQELAHVLLDLGEYERSEQMLLESLEQQKRVTHSEFLVDCEVNLTTLYVSWQPPHGKIMALRHAKAALEVARELDLPRAIRKALVGLASAENLNAQHLQALAHADEAMAVNQANGFGYSVAAQCERAAALEGLGQPDAALLAYQEAESHALSSEPLKTQHLIGLETDRLTNNLERTRQRLKYFEEHGFKSCADLVKKYFKPFQTPSIDITEHPSNTITLEILGSTRISQNDQVIASRGTKRYELLAVLLEARMLRRSEVSQLELLEVLYHETSEDQAAQSLKKIVQLTRDHLGRGSIQTTSGGYALGDVRSDAERFLETGDTNLWRGAYLEGLRLDQNDETVSEVLYQTLKIRIRALLEFDPKEAARVSKFLLSAEPYDLMALEFALRALRSSENHRSLTRLYADARTRFLEVNNVLPERWQDFLEARETLVTT
jgi:hypothetical protein